MGQLTTHILDTVRGMPAAGVDIRVYSLVAGRELRAAAVTKADGRTAAPLLAGEAMRSGTYELEFDIGAYFAARGDKATEPPFLDTVVIRVTLDADDSYHVPLLASPWSYSTYRGS